MGCNFCGARGELETPITAERIEEMQEQLLKVLEKMPESIATCVVQHQEGLLQKKNL